MIATVPASAPLALGGGPAGDPYVLPTQLAAMVVAEAGMRAMNLGPDTPVSAFAHAVVEHHPKLVWLSISTPLAPARGRALASWLAELPAATAIVIGGNEARTLTKVPARTVRATSMADLAAAGRALVKRPRAS